MLDKDGRIIVANRRLAQIYNLGDRGELAGLTVREFISLCRQSGAGVARVITDETDKAVSGQVQTSHRVVELDDGRVMTMKVIAALRRRSCRDPRRHHREAIGE
ncbi:MAG: hypothetical protein KL863_24740 [Rhizobium sp.]|nr:hypothetical protein [Rhizobium sp.]MBX9458984.1 hypothetical protein [Rhizobium sp.]